MVQFYSLGDRNIIRSSDLRKLLYLESQILGYNYPAFMGMELIPDYLVNAYGGKYYESYIYNDELNREAVKEFENEFLCSENK